MLNRSSTAKGPLVTTTSGATFLRLPLKAAKKVTNHPGDAFNTFKSQLDQIIPPPNIAVKLPNSRIEPQSQSRLNLLSPSPILPSREGHDQSQVEVASFTPYYPQEGVQSTTPSGHKEPMDSSAFFKGHGRKSSVSFQQPRMRRSSLIQAQSQEMPSDTSIASIKPFLAVEPKSGGLKSGEAKLDNKAKISLPSGIHLGNINTTQRGASESGSGLRRLKSLHKSGASPGSRNVNRFSIPTLPVSQSTVNLQIRRSNGLGTFHPNQSANEAGAYSATIKEKSKRQEDDTGDDRHSSQLKGRAVEAESDSSFDSEVQRQKRTERLRKAKELEEALLRRSCSQLMKSVRDQTEEVKLAQFKKFFPEVYKKVASQLKEVGVKTDRKPIVEHDKDSASNWAQANTMHRTSTSTGALRRRHGPGSKLSFSRQASEVKSFQRVSIVGEKQTKMIMKKPLETQFPANRLRMSVAGALKNKIMQIQSQMEQAKGGSTKAGTTSQSNRVSTCRSSLSMKLPIKLIRQRTISAFKNKQADPNESKIRWDDTTLAQAPAPNKQAEPSFIPKSKTPSPIKDTIAVEPRETEIRRLDAYRPSINTSSSRFSSRAHKRELTHLQSDYDVRHELRNPVLGNSSAPLRHTLAKMSLPLRIHYQKEILLGSPLIEQSLLKKFQGVEPSSSSRFSKSDRFYNKKRLLDKMGQVYAYNAGAWILVKGVIEHMYAVGNAAQGVAGSAPKKAQGKQSHAAVDASEEISVEGMRHYLTDWLLTPDKAKQCETAFSLYLYLSRQKMLISKQKGAQQGWHQESSLSQPSSSMLGDNSVRSRKLIKGDGLMGGAATRLTMIKEQQSVASSRGLSPGKDTKNPAGGLQLPISNAAKRQPNRHNEMGGCKSPLLSKRGSVRSSSLLKGLISIDGIAEQSCVEPGAPQTGSDLLMTDDDVFNVVGSPAVSFLQYDTRLLLKLISEQGMSKAQLADLEAQFQPQAQANQGTALNADIFQSGLNTSTNRGGAGGSKCSGANQSFEKQPVVVNSVLTLASDPPLSSARLRPKEGLAGQAQLDRQQERQKQRLRLLTRKVCSTYNRAFLPTNDKKNLKKSLAAMKRNRSEVEVLNEERTGTKPFKLDNELLGQTFTPYKLRLIEQTQKLQNDALFLKNIFHKPGDRRRSKTPVEAGDRGQSVANQERVQNISQAIQNKAVLKRYRNLHSACSLYNLVNANPEPFMKSEGDSSLEEQDEDVDTARQRLLKKVTCPLKYRVEQKVIREKFRRGNRDIVVKRPFLKLIKEPDNFHNPWERTASIGPDGTFKFKQGLERLLLTKREQDAFIETVRINTRLKEFRDKADYDREGAKQKLQNCLTLAEFKSHAVYEMSEGIPEIIIVAVYLLFGPKLLAFYFEDVLNSKEVIKVEEWPKVMDKDPKYYIFCHKQIKREDPLDVDYMGLLIPKIVIRRDLSLPIVLSTFRKNALQHAIFFHQFLGQSVSYNKLARCKETNRLPDFELNQIFLKKVAPLFSQLCDPYTSYNEGVYGITLKQFTYQSELLFGKLATFFGERVYQYLLQAQRRTLVALQGGEHRFKHVKTPRDYISYQSFLDFCFDCCRSHMQNPFDKRHIELEMLDRHSLLSIDREDVNLLDEGVRQYLSEVPQSSRQIGNSYELGNIRQRKRHSRETTRVATSQSISMPKKPSLMTRKSILKSKNNAELTRRQSLAVAASKTLDVNFQSSSEEDSYLHSESDIDPLERRLQQEQNAYDTQAQYNDFLRLLVPPIRRNLEHLVQVLKDALAVKQAQMDIEAEEKAADAHAERSKTGMKSTVTDLQSHEMGSQEGGEKTRDRAKLFKDDYIKLVDATFGKNASPILDVIAWHIHRASYEIIKYNEEDDVGAD